MMMMMMNSTVWWKRWDIIDSPLIGRSMTRLQWRGYKTFSSEQLFEVSVSPHWCTTTRFMADCHRAPINIADSIRRDAGEATARVRRTLAAARRTAGSAPINGGGCAALWVTNGATGLFHGGASHSASAGRRHLTSWRRSCRPWRHYLLLQLLHVVTHYFLVRRRFPAQLQAVSII